MNVLLYYQNPYHTVFLESLVQSFIDKGHTVYFLTTCNEGILHEKMREFGAIIHTYNPKKSKLGHYFAHFRFLIRFCRKNKIDVVFSHLQFVNLVAVFAQFFIKARVFPCRHHANDVMLRGNKNAILMDKLVNRLSKKIIVVSNAVKQQMVTHEKVKPSKIEVIPLGYNFLLYDQPDAAKVAEIRQALNTEMILIVIGRMTVNKKHITVLEAFNSLIKQGLDLKLIVMDEGPEEKNIHAYVAEHSLSDKIIFTGFLNNTMNHLACANLLIQPSVSEASNQVVKEAALLGIPSIVCKGTGDFDEYIFHEKNGLVVNPATAIHEIIDLVNKYYYRKSELETMGKNIRESVLLKFDINAVSDKYLHLAQNNKS